MALRPGDRLGPYEILGLLGAGGMGEVYRARDPRLGREVALKVLPPALADDVEHLRRFEQEARTVSALNHPGIVAIYDVGAQDGVSFLILELLEGETLRSLLARGLLSVRKAVDHAAQVARGLAAAHAKGIVHRDLKPENIFVSADGHVKILDFGLAKAIPAPLAPLEATTASLVLGAVHTEPGVVLGTLDYMSPEQLRGQPADARSDLFSLGAVLYEMLAGRRPFAGSTAADAVSAILGQDPPALAASGAQVPAGLERIVARCLEKRPEDRFQSAKDLAFALEALTDTSGASAALAQGPVAVRPTRSRIALALAGVVIAALVIHALAVTRRPLPRLLTSVRFELTLPDGVTPARFPVASSMALSPDGRQLALVAFAKGKQMLWLRLLDRLEATALEGTEGAASPFWSPDGHAIAFFAGGMLKRIAITGGPAEALCEAEFGNAGAWGSDGTVLFTESAGGRAGLYRVSSRGGTPAAIALHTASGPETGFAWPAFLADGRHFVYLSGAFGHRPTRTIAVASIDSLEAKHVGPADSQTVPVAGGRLLFVREGTLLVQAFDPEAARLTGEPTPVADLVWFKAGAGTAQFAASADGRALAFRGPPSPSRLVWLDRRGRELGTVGAPGILDRPILSPDGGRVAFELEEPRAGTIDIWVHDLVRDLRSRVTLDPLDAIRPIWSPDGERLLYGSASQTGRPLQMCIRRADGSGSEEAVLPSNESQRPEHWSPDGRWILFSDISPGRRPPRQLWLLPLEGERRPAALESTPVSRYDGRFSPDGRWVAFVSEETGRPDVFVSPFRGSGRRRQVSTAGGVRPRWRRDGRELFYLSPEQRLMAVPLAAGPDLEVTSPGELFAVGSGGDATYDVDARGERFLFSLASEGPPPIVVAIGWEPARKE